VTYTDTQWMLCWVEKLPSGRYVVVRGRHRVLQGRPYATDAEAQAKADAANERIHGSRFARRPGPDGSEAKARGSRWAERAVRPLS
jgi:hypothetical protein